MTLAVLVRAQTRAAPFIPRELIHPGGVTADSATGTPRLFSASNKTRRQSFAQTRPQITHVRFLHEPPRQPASHLRRSPRVGGIRSA
jgi:hypothetical protein